MSGDGYFWVFEQTEKGFLNQYANQLPKIGSDPIKPSSMLILILFVPCIPTGILLQITQKYYFRIQHHRITHYLDFLTQPKTTKCRNKKLFFVFPICESVKITRKKVKFL